MTQVHARGPGHPVIDHLTFEALIDPLPVEEFLRDHGRLEWIRHGESDRFSHLLSWQALNLLIRNNNPTAPRFRLVKGGRVVPEAAYHRTIGTLRGPLRLLDNEGLLAELRGGATVVWDAIDQVHPPIRALKEVVERALGAFAFVNMYASWGSVGALGGHWDDHDVFVLQVIGRKRWRVHPSANKALSGDMRLDPPDDYKHEWVMDEGTVLYLPRGWWHEVTPMGEPSLHLTIGVLRPTNADFLNWLMENVSESALVREDFPVFRDDEARVAHAAALREVLDHWLQPTMLALYQTLNDEGHYLDPRPTLQAVADPDPTAWDPDSNVVLLSTRACLRTSAEGVALLIAGQEWIAPLAAEPCLRALVEGRPTHLRAVLGEVPGELISDLVTHGILAVT
jgi:ribosomal protein L16 Arg81 hydroxylase